MITVFLYESLGVFVCLYEDLGRHLERLWASLRASWGVFVRLYENLGVTWGVFVRHFCQYISEPPFEEALPGPKNELSDSSYFIV